MAVGSWTPSGDNSVKLDESVLKRWLIVAEQGLEDLNSQMKAEDISNYSHWMTLDKGPWVAVATTFSNEELLLLMKFFTVAEEQLSGWQAGAKSPVVWLGKVLKTRNAFPDTEFIGWIKAHTNNRFLPYGDILSR